MAAKKAAKGSKPSKASAKAKPAGKKARTLNPPTGGRGSVGAPASEQDPKRRLGNFTTAGEHARQGGRTTGIVGQTKQRTRTDKKGTKKVRPLK